ncbi:aldolase/citrate lyase family protein [Dechloromonas sp. XY25]|uniref:Aldolase/citrate lyase family protein n=1 Tax=Dechloromonas hankyongensis TaxID=2908002 RepID=A0ABS9K7Q4_9RHOO|nr:aldolase/citrate lyase family protein [Dechloromonas hankyongensis]MCG2579199.1 aldolase/citrate lyase family protein [Dechloromonas hankyongensis]
MDMPLNAFKRALAAGETQIGLFLGMANAYAAEVVATAGFDWLLIDGEHGPNDLRSIIEQLQVLGQYPVRPVVRTVDHDVARIKQLLDGGVQTLMVPMVETAAEAESLVRAMRYPPHGIRGVGTALARAARWNGVDGYFAQADREMCLIVQIESTAGLAGLADILKVEGVDAVFIGPSDLAASMGHLGNPGHPEVKAAVEFAIRQIAAAGKAAGVFSADPGIAAAYREMGASFLLVGVDALLLRNASVALADKFKSAGAAKSGAAY